MTEYCAQNTAVKAYIEGVLHEVPILEVLEELDHVLDVIVHRLEQLVEALQHIEVSLAEVLIEFEQLRARVDPLIEGLP